MCFPCDPLVEQALQQRYVQGIHGGEEHVRQDELQESQQRLAESEALVRELRVQVMDLQLWIAGELFECRGSKEVCRWIEGVAFLDGRDWYVTGARYTRSRYFWRRRRMGWWGDHKLVQPRDTRKRVKFPHLSVTIDGHACQWDSVITQTGVLAEGLDAKLQMHVRSCAENLDIE